jgi:2-C-methyl-D-erythritol 4-phosphate cytidylyltransferase/2-C-methyl-D-erythritol 2,4-cyclodiphosphate synthase
VNGCVALIVASGRGERFGAELPKQYLPLAGRPVLRHSLHAFLEHARVDEVRVVIHQDDLDRYAEATAGLEPGPPVLGGATRQESVRLGLEALAEDPPARVLIHDGVRPLIDHALIDRVVDALDRAEAVLPALPVTDTLKRAEGARVHDTVDRTGLVRAQTPQGFAFHPILEAHRRFRGEALTDDTALASAAGIEVRIVAGAEDNLKITMPDDLARAERILAGNRMTRVGLGFDVHALGPGDSLVLCGVRIPFEASLIGHSDADVGLHALTDALFGALGEGDIGSHFPPSEPRWRGADSAVFLQHAGARVAARGGRIEHLDLTLICERPKIGPLRDRMVARVAEILGLPKDRVSVKATTTERLGFTGRGEGIAAQAVATVSLPG